MLESASCVAASEVALRLPSGSMQLLSVPRRRGLKFHTIGEGIGHIHRGRGGALRYNALGGWSII